MAEPSCGFGTQHGSASPTPSSLAFQIIPDDTSMVVQDSNGNHIYKVKSCNTTTHSKREVVETADGIEYPRLMLKKRLFTAHARCDGYSTSSDAIKTYRKKLFSVSKNDIRQDHTELNVKLEYRIMFLDEGVEEYGSLLNNLLDKDYSLENEALITYLLKNGSLEEKENDNNFKIVGSWSKKVLTIYKGGSSTEIAKVRPLDTMDKFTVDVSSNIDCTLVVSLIAAVDCMKDNSMLKLVSKVGVVALKAMTVVGAAATAGGQAADFFSS